MIAKAISFLRSQLADALKDQKPDAVPVFMRNLVDERGEPTMGGDNGVSLTLVSIDEDTTTRGPYFEPPAPRPALKRGEEPSGPLERTPLLRLHLFVLVTAGIRKSEAAQSDSAVSGVYGDALGRLTQAVSYFHLHPTFTGESLPDGLKQLSVQLVNQSVQDKQSMWSYLGSKYLPSVLYKVSLLSLLPTTTEDPSSRVRTIDASATHKTSD